MSRPIRCRFCGNNRRYDTDPSDPNKTTPVFIRPLASNEDRWMRAMLLDEFTKSYFCDLLCFYRHTQKLHPDGYRAKTKAQIENDHELQSNHGDWRRVVWLEDAFAKCADMKSNDLVVLEHEERIIEETIEKLRAAEADQAALDGPYAPESHDVFADDVQETQLTREFTV